MRGVALNVRVARHTTQEPAIRPRSTEAESFVGQFTVLGHGICFGSDVPRRQPNDVVVASPIGEIGRPPFLYLADNAGEIVFDRLLIERLPAEKVTLAVRGGAVLNDATLIDAENTGITELVEVIRNGSDAPGTILEDCSEEFKRCFAAADLIVAKGQGNYESLSHFKKKIYFLLTVKCSVVAQDLKCCVNDLVLQTCRI